MLLFSTHCYKDWQWPSWTFLEKYLSTVEPPSKVKPSITKLFTHENQIYCSDQTPAGKSSLAIFIFRCTELVAFPAARCLHWFGVCAASAAYQSLAQLNETQSSSSHFTAKKKNCIWPGTLLLFDLCIAAWAYLTIMSRLAPSSAMKLHWKFTAIGAVQQLCVAPIALTWIGLAWFGFKNRHMPTHLWSTTVNCRVRIQGLR